MSSTEAYASGSGSSSKVALASEPNGVDHISLQNPSSLPAFAPPSGDPRTTAQRQPFDENDPRVYFDRSSHSWRCELHEDERQSELEWDTARQAWVPVFDEEALRQQQAAYSVEGVDESTPVAPVLRRQKKKRRRSPHGEADGGDDAAAAPSSSKQRKRVNTSVYVTGLPLDCSRDEIAQVFARYGVLNEDDDGNARVKMYTDPKTGMFKGEALVTYFMADSVELAINVLDESALRASEGKTNPKMRLSRAEFGTKEQRERDETSKAKAPAADQRGQHAIDQAPTQAPAQRDVRPQLSAADKKKAAKRYAKMNGKLLDWNSESEDESEAGSLRRKDTRAHVQDDTSIRTVCLRRMFTLAELEDDPTLLLDLKEDVREECETFGPVNSVSLWDKEPEGIMTIKFAKRESALACVEKMDARFFAGRQIVAHLLEGKPRFKRSIGGAQDEDEANDDPSTTEEQSRQDQFGAWLEQRGEESTHDQ